MPARQAQYLPTMLTMLNWLRRYRPHGTTDVRLRSVLPPTVIVLISNSTNESITHEGVDHAAIRIQGLIFLCGVMLLQEDRGFVAPIVRRTR
jgi:hypothetical protein